MAVGPAIAARKEDATIADERAVINLFGKDRTCWTLLKDRA